MTHNRALERIKPKGLPVILAAAGRSRRYGRPKLLESVPGTDKLLIQHVMEQLTEGGAWPVIVVLGPTSVEPYDLIGNHVKTHGGVALHIDPHPEEMRDSIVAGINYLEGWIKASMQPDPSHILFTPSDLPNMNLAYVRALIQCCQVRADSLIRGVTPEGRGMHPVGLSWTDRHAIDRIPSHLGLNELWKNPELNRFEWTWHDSYGHLDLDNPQDWKNFRQTP
jgi:CTP:molybdopterin cytidylyltransferase MocA